jgi:hypothetical protein
MSDEEKKEPIIEVKPDERFALVHARLDHQEDYLGRLGTNFVFLLGLCVFLMVVYIMLLGAILEAK